MISRASVSPVTLGYHLLVLCVPHSYVVLPTNLADYGRGSDLSQCYHHSELVDDAGNPQKVVPADEFAMYQKKRAPTAAVPTAIFFLQVRNRALLQCFYEKVGFGKTCSVQQPESFNNSVAFQTLGLVAKDASFFGLLDVLMLDMEKVAGTCIAPMTTSTHFYAKTFLMPVTLFAFIFLVAAPVWTALRRQKALAKLWQHLQAPQELTRLHMERALLGMYLFVFTPLTKDAVIKLVCVKTSIETTEDTPEVLSTDFSVSCGSDEFRAMAFLSILIIFTLLIAIPSFLLYKTKESRTKRDARLHMDVRRIEEMFQLVDEDKSGLIEEPEIKLMLDYLKEPSGQAEVKRVLQEFKSLPRTLFKKVDEDGSGNLSNDEVMQVMADIGRQLEGDELAEAFARMDTDGSGEVSFEVRTTDFSSSQLGHCPQFIHGAWVCAGRSLRNGFSKTRRSKFKLQPLCRAVILWKILEMSLGLHLLSFTLGFDCGSLARLRLLSTSCMAQPGQNVSGGSLCCCG